MHSVSLRASPALWNLVAVPLLGVLAVAHGVTVTSTIAGALVAAPRAPLDAPLPPAPLFHRTSSAALFARDEPPARVDVAPSFASPYDAPRCPAIRVAALAASSSDVSSSFVSLEGASETTAPRRQGERYGERVVWYVGVDRAWLVGADGLCQATLREVPALAAPPSAHALAEPASGLAARIERRGPDDYAVDRPSFEALIEQAPLLARGVRASFEQEGGRTLGLRLSGIRAGDPLSAFGLASGDRLERIDGVELSGPDKAIEAYARARLREHVAIVVRRGEALRTIDLWIR